MAAARSNTAGRIRVGVGGWTFAPWRGGAFFPKGLPQAKELAFAAHALSTIEINGSFYRLQSVESFRRWAEQTPEDFVFSLKAHRLTTVRKSLADGAEAVTRFLNSGLTELGPKLGPILWQLAPTKRFDRDDLKNFLDLLPARLGSIPLRHVLEARHESFGDPSFVDLLRERNIALCIADNPKYPAWTDITADFVYARLQNAEASCETGYSNRAIDQWTKRFGAWSAGHEDPEGQRIAKAPAPAPAAKSRDVFVYVINGAKERAPAAAQAFLKKLGEERAPMPVKASPPSSARKPRT